MTHNLNTSKIGIVVAEDGAELVSLKGLKTNKEYLWTGDPTYWGRHAPVLFPIVGSVWDKTFRINGKAYTMGQHGFARDSRFEVLEKTDDYILLGLRATAESKEKYPFDFELRIGYRIVGAVVDVEWEIRNHGTEDMPFQIGAHPAFFYLEYGQDDTRGTLEIEGEDVLWRRPIKGGFATPEKRQLTERVNGKIALRKGTFDELDTIILEDHQTRRISLLDNAGKRAVSVWFDAPVVGIWSPPKKDAPFICIEPWYGRCDREGYTGEFRDRDHVQILGGGARWSTSYRIVLDGEEA